MIPYHREYEYYLAGIFKMSVTPRSGAGRHHKLDGHGRSLMSEAKTSPRKEPRRHTVKRDEWLAAEKHARHKLKKLMWNVLLANYSVTIMKVADLSDLGMDFEKFLDAGEFFKLPTNFAGSFTLEQDVFEIMDSETRQGGKTKWICFLKGWEHTLALMKSEDLATELEGVDAL